MSLLAGLTDAEPPVTASRLNHAERRAEEYRGRALAATALAGTSALDHVRRKHEAAAVRWLELAAISAGDSRATSITVPARPAGASTNS